MPSPVAWWSGMSRQKRTGWTIVIVALAYILYFLKARVFAVGPEITTKEWVYFVLMIGCIMLGTVRERNQKVMPLIDPELLSKNKK